MNTGDYLVVAPSGNLFAYRIALDDLTKCQSNYIPFMIGGPAPQSSSDTSGVIGSITAVGDTLYIKNTAGSWRCVTLSGIPFS